MSNLSIGYGLQLLSDDVKESKIDVIKEMLLSDEAI